jgi:cysteine sulfinate desulfinase/cysteine desulfurase-like protein
MHKTKYKYSFHKFGFEFTNCFEILRKEFKKEWNKPNTNIFFTNADLDFKNWTIIKNLKKNEIVKGSAKKIATKFKKKIKEKCELGFIIFLVYMEY